MIKLSKLCNFQLFQAILKEISAIKNVTFLTSFFAFLASFFFLLLGINLVGFILMGRVFRKAFRILGLGERKGRWVMEQDFHGDLQVNLAWFFAFFSSVLD